MTETIIIESPRRNVVLPRKLATSIFAGLMGCGKYRRSGEQCVNCRAKQPPGKPRLCKNCRTKNEAAK